MRMCGGGFNIVMVGLRNKFCGKPAGAVHNLRAEVRLLNQWLRVRVRGRRCRSVTGTEVWVSGADTGAVVPVTLSEADIAIIVNRVTRNLQPPTAGGTSVCSTSSEGGGDMVAIVCMWEGLLC